GSGCAADFPPRFFQGIIPGAPRVTTRLAFASSRVLRSARIQLSGRRVARLGEDVRGAEDVGRLHAAEVVNQESHQARPSRLVAGANAGAVIAVKVFIEQQAVAPVRIRLELRGASEHGPAPAAVA